MPTRTGAELFSYKTRSAFALIEAVASASIAIALYPVLRKYHEGLALGAVGFGLIEGVFSLVKVMRESSDPCHFVQ